MILAPLVGLSLLVSVTTGPATDTGAAAASSTQQMSAAMRPFVRSATECVARKIVADPRASEQKDAGDFRDLIVEAVPSCADKMRAMIDAYDRYFGDGSGEIFFNGPYLEVLPTAVSKWVEILRAK